MSSINQFGIASDYLVLIEELYDAGVAQCIELKVVHTRIPISISIEAVMHFRGMNYEVQLRLATDVLLSDDREEYLNSIAYEIARLFGEAIFLRK